MTKRNYRNQVAMVVQGIASAVQQAGSLRSSAQRLLAAGDHALALSVAVLSLEETGKSFLIDGLLFAKARDEKSVAFEKGHRKHTEKLRAVEFLPGFVQKYALSDPRSDSSPVEFGQAIAAELTGFIRARRGLERLLGKDKSLTALDGLKQSGFYTELTNGKTFILPAQAISPELAAAVVLLASAGVGALNLIFANGTSALEEFAVEIRSGMSESDHEVLEAEFEELYAGTAGNGSVDRMH